MGKEIDAQIESLRGEISRNREELSKLYRSREPEPVKDYDLVTSDGIATRLSELFGEHEDLILVHNMGRNCAYCTMWADGFVSSMRHLTSRAAFVVSSPDEPSVQREIRKDRGWTFDMVSTAGSTLTKDLGFASERGYMPGVSALHRNGDGSIVRTNWDWFGPYDDYNPTWHLFNLLDGGAGHWEPQPPS